MSVLQSSVNWVLAQAHARLGDPYVYGGSYSPTDLEQGCDCSGAAAFVLEALTRGPDGVTWDHPVSTESWTPGAPPGTVGPFGTIAVACLEDIPADAALTVNIMHGPGGGENSHMNVVVPLPGSLPYEGVIVESNGDYGSCTNGTGAYLAAADLWTDHHYLPGPWVFDVPPVDPDAPIPVGPAGGNTYTVQLGDSIDGIAGQFGVSVEALLAANPQITNPNVILTGEIITIP